MTLGLGDWRDDLPAVDGDGRRVVWCEKLVVARDEDGAPVGRINPMRFGTYEWTPASAFQFQLDGNTTYMEPSFVPRPKNVKGLRMAAWFIQQAAKRVRLAIRDFIGGAKADFAIPSLYESYPAVSHGVEGQMYYVHASWNVFRRDGR